MSCKVSHQAEDLNHLFQTVKHVKDDRLQLNWTHTYSRCHLRKSQMSSQMSVDDKISALVGCMDQLGKTNAHVLL